jgi:hypothetical protein
VQTDSRQYVAGAGGKIVQRHSLLSLLWLEGDGLLAAIGLSQQDLDLLLGLLQLLLAGPHQMNALLKLLEGLFQRQEPCSS